MLCLSRNHTTLFTEDGGASLRGEAGFWLAISYMAIGAFIHFHYFWGLSERLWPFSQTLKTLSLITFLGSFFRAIYHWIS